MADHGYGCPLDGEPMSTTANCAHCCRHGWVESAQAKQCPECYPPKGGVMADTLVERLREAAEAARRHRIFYDEALYREAADRIGLLTRSLEMLCKQQAGEVIYRPDAGGTYPPQSQGDGSGE
jgi:hypothetical protein